MGIGALIIGDEILVGKRQDKHFPFFVGALAKRGLSPWWATVISAAAFAALHLQPVRFILLFGTGLVLGYLRQRTGRLGPPIIAHAVNNGIAALGLIAAV